jgi:hypothetical protein
MKTMFQIERRVSLGNSKARRFVGGLSLCANAECLFPNAE